VIIYRLAKATGIRDTPDTGTEWAEGQHPYPQDDGIPHFTTEHICGTATIEQFFQWWHDMPKLVTALYNGHCIYKVHIAPTDVLVGRNQVMFRPEDVLAVEKWYLQGVEA